VDKEPEMTNKLRDEAERLAKETLQRWSDGCVFHEDGRIRITINGEGIDANRDGVSLLKGITTALLAFKGEERIFEVEGNRCPQCGTENLKIAELEQQLTDGGKLVYSEYKSQKETIEYLQSTISALKAGLEDITNNLAGESFQRAYLKAKALLSTLPVKEKEPCKAEGVTVYASCPKCGEKLIVPIKPEALQDKGGNK
jgi:DNA-directed RNA polymerase subunit RPC12/RpoP